MSETVRIVVTPDGTVKGVYSDALRPILQEGTATIRRASHVEPTADGQWTADLSPSAGPVLGPFPTRAEALAAEVAWLRANLHL